MNQPLVSYVTARHGANSSEEFEPRHEERSRPGKYDRFMGQPFGISGLTLRLDRWERS